jgi:uncharacterized RDD family membrane protein YckC
VRVPEEDIKVGVGDRGAGEANSVRPSYASVGRRLAAYLLDLPIAFVSVMVPVYLIMQLLIVTGAWAPAGDQAPWSSHTYLSRISIVIAFLLSTGPIYMVLCHASPWQATVGKRLLNIYVTGEDGKRISLPRSLVRWVALWLFQLIWGWVISIITMTNSRQQKALHDFVAHTLVLNGRPSPGGTLGVWRIVAAVAPPVAWMLTTFLETM